MSSFRFNRRQKGQAIAEGAAFLLILIPLMIGLVFLTLFIVINGYYHVILAQVADSGARSAVNQRYWLGAQRPDYDAAATGGNVQTLISSLWKTIGLPGTITSTVDVSSPTIVTVSVYVTGAPIPTCGFLPAGLQLAATSAEPYNIDRPTGVLGFTVADPTNGNGNALYLPAYGAGGLSPGGPSVYPSNGTYDAPYWSTCVAKDVAVNPSLKPISAPTIGPSNGTAWTSYSDHYSY